MLISVYDAIAVWKTKHMVSLAKFQNESRVFAGLNIPYLPSVQKNIKKGVKSKKITVTDKIAILGGGDIAFPLLFFGVVLRDFSFVHAIWSLAGATIFLTILLVYSKKEKFYPAMPFLSIGCFLGFLISLI